MALAGCSEDSKTGGGGEGEGEGPMCQIGTAGCGCNASFPCSDDGYFCVEETCVECTDGAEGCGCKEDGSCDGELVCTRPDSTCQVSCDPSVCKPPA